MSDVKNSLFLKNLRGEPTDRTPIWIMRQAGRYLPEYQEVRSRLSFTELCHTPEAACEVTLQPIRRFGFDAAIMFSDILTPLEPMGAPFDFSQGGPKLAKPLRSEEEIDSLRIYEAREGTRFVAEAIKLMKEGLGDKTPLIGFAGSPFTLATYLIEGGGSKDYRYLKTMLYSRPELLDRLMAKLTDQTLDYLTMQVEAGVDAVQLFDTWGGILHPADYARGGSALRQAHHGRAEGQGRSAHLLPEGQRALPRPGHHAGRRGPGHGLDHGHDQEPAPDEGLRGSGQPGSHGVVRFGR